MNLALYIVFGLIVLISIWSGYKHGLILSVAHLAAIVASLYLAALLSGAFSNEIVSGMRPFAEGFLDHQVAVPLDGVGSAFVGAAGHIGVGGLHARQLAQPLDQYLSVIRVHLILHHFPVLSGVCPCDAAVPCGAVH